MPDEPDITDATDVAGTADSDGWVDESLEETWAPAAQDESTQDAADDETAEEFPEVLSPERAAAEPTDNAAAWVAGQDEVSENLEASSVEAQDAVSEDDSADSVEAQQRAVDEPAQHPDEPAQDELAVESVGESAAMSEEPDAAEVEPAAEARVPLALTGHPAVDAVLSSLEGLEERPVGEHVAVFEQAHAGLRQALDDGHAS